MAAIVSVGHCSTADKGEETVMAARKQIGVTVRYDPAYVSLDFPGGDVPKECGVCTDVVVRALRSAQGFDLQKEVNADMRANFSKYPKIWGLKRTDRNIDHRRVPNLRVYFKRQGWSLPVSDTASDYQPGDIVTCTVGGNRPHVMLVSDHLNDAGQPLVIHNIGGGTSQDDYLFTFPITGHFRIQ